MENGAFFVPWFDKDGYIEGINGKKLLVLGASFYCNQDGKRNERCEYYDDCEYAEITPGSDVAVCRKIGGVMQLHSKCKKFKYDPFKRQPKTMALNKEFSKEDFEL